MVSPKRKDAGFTLVELMTVLVIIGLMSSAVILSLPKRKQVIEIEANTLVQTLNLAAQESILTGRTHAWGVSQNSHGFFQFDGTQWIIIKEREWPSSIGFKLVRQETELDPEETIIPSIFFEPTGLSTPFILSLSGPDRDITIESDGTSGIKRQEPAL